MRPLWSLTAALLLCVGAAALAQEASLRAREVTIVQRTGAWGRQQAVIEGRLHNEGSLAQVVSQLQAVVYDAQDARIGEGFGFLTGVCGEALPPEHALQPGESAPFALQLELYVLAQAPPDARIVVLPQARSRQPAARSRAPDLPGITQMDEREVVELEWLDAQQLRYSSGCWRDVFTLRAWHELDLGTGERRDLAAHPRAAELNAALLEAIRQGDPQLFRRSFFRFAPGQRRAFFQNELNSLVTVEPNGSFARILFDGLYNITLQGVQWHGASGNFVAWYHGGPGHMVRYASGNAEGRPLSQHPNEAIPSYTLPGLSESGRGLVISATVDGLTGYFLKDSASDFTLPMFAAEPPGNHWPAPWYAHTPAGRRIYIARPLNGEARLQCHNPDSGALHDLTALPLRLAPQERSRMALSPDFATLALAANGAQGGLWLIDLQQFAACA